MNPTLAGFQLFLQMVVGISVSILDPNDPVVSTAFNIALQIVNPVLMQVPATNTSTPSLYTLAVYNLAADGVLNFAQDKSDAPNILGSGDPGMPFFAWTRKQLNLAGFLGGVISSASDQGTSQSMLLQDAMHSFTVANLQQLKTPFGRQYIAIAQSYGPAVWGLT